MQPQDTGAVLWSMIDDIFRDNQLSHAMYPDTEYHAVAQSDLTV